MNQQRLFKAVTKQELELIAFLSGVIASLASSTGYFYGRFADIYGPVATWSIAIVWFGFFWKITSIHVDDPPNGPSSDTSSKDIDNTSESKEPSEDIHRNTIEAERSTAMNSGSKRNNLHVQDKEEKAINYYTYPWIWTFTIWTLGIFTHLSLPTQLMLNGYVTYGSEKNLHNSNAKIEVYYANKKIIDLYTDKYGYYHITLDKILNQNIIYLRIESENFNPESVEIPVNEFTQRIENYDIQVFPILKPATP